MLSKRIPNPSCLIRQESRPDPGFLVDEMIISTLPILLGGGVPLFGELAQPLSFQYLKTEVYLDALSKAIIVVSDKAWGMHFRDCRKH